MYAPMWALADVWRPSSRSHALLYDGALTLAGSALIALMAQLSLRLPWTPVPITGQTFAVLLEAAVLGARRGASAVALYLCMGAAGMPVFALGSGGIAHLLGPTGGYLFGFLGAAWLVGWLAEHGWDRRLPTAALALLLGNALIYACGLPWLALFVGWSAVLPLGLFPFILGDLFKLLLAMLLLPASWRFVRTLSPVGSVRQVGRRSAGA